ncbi:MAG: PEP-utilizing enzyme [Acidimicrobiales bacterium]
MPIWLADNPLSTRWPLYTRGNVGEVFPEVVLPFTWSVYGQEAENGWRDSYQRLGLIADGDFPDDENMIILGVFGGYCYINASYVRLLGVRAPGGKVEVIDQQFFGESDAPPYTERPGDKNRKASAKLGKSVLQLLGTKSLPALEEDKRRVAAWIAQYPAADAPDDVLMDYIEGFKPLFRHLFGRHIDNTFGVALVSGALQDLLVKIGRGDQLVSILGGIGDVESAAPSAAMWKLAHSPHDRASDEWQREFAAFLAEFGSRGPNEWDLGSDPWAYRPQLALAAIDRMAAADESHDPSAQSTRLASEREAAIHQARGELNRIDRVVFDKALRATTLYSQARERSKTTIIRAIHSVREAQRELARRAAERGGVADPKASCLLEFDEFRQYLENPTPWLSVIAERQTRYEQLAGLIPPFILDGEIPPIETWEQRGAPADTVSVGQQLKGIAGCPGVARGTAVVVLDPGDPRQLGPGDVLVAPITDPSWTPLFLAAEAVVVDVGATMSHAIIVSRELGIPCVVSAVGATRSIPDGATIEVDGNTGIVTVIELP